MLRTAILKQRMFNIIVTPVNLEKPSTKMGKKAKIDYERERSISDNFTKITECGCPKWDDSQYNKAVVGDLFGFVQNKKNIIEYFEIVSITPAVDRPDYWDIPEHQRRQILHLSPKKGTGKFSEFKSRRDPPLKENYKVQGTTRHSYTLNN